MALKDIITKVEAACAASKFHIGGTASSYAAVAKIELSKEERQELLATNNINEYSQGSFGSWRVNGCTKTVSADMDLAIIVETAGAGNCGKTSSGTYWYTQIGQARLSLKANSAIPSFTDWVNTADGKAAILLQEEVARKKKPESYVTKDSAGELQAYTSAHVLIPQ